jgi:hypothetical protein
VVEVVVAVPIEGRKLRFHDAAGRGEEGEWVRTGTESHLFDVVLENVEGEALGEDYEMAGKLELAVVVEEVEGVVRHLESIERNSLGVLTSQELGAAVPDEVKGGYHLHYSLLP